MAGAMGCLPDTLCSVALPNSAGWWKIAKLLAGTGVHPPKDYPKCCHQTSGSGWPGNSRCKAYWWEMLIHQTRAHSEKQVGFKSLARAKKRSFCCGVKVHVVNLYGDWELRRLGGREKLRDEPVSTSLGGLEWGCLFLCQGQCWWEPRNQSWVFREKHRRNFVWDLGLNSSVSNGSELADWGAD